MNGRNFGAKAGFCVSGLRGIGPAVRGGAGEPSLPPSRGTRGDRGGSTGAGACLGWPLPRPLPACCACGEGRIRLWCRWPRALDCACSPRRRTSGRCCRDFSRPSRAEASAFVTAAAPGMRSGRGWILRPARCPVRASEARLGLRMTPGPGRATSPNSHRRKPVREGGLRVFVAANSIHSPVQGRRRPIPRSRKHRPSPYPGEGRSTSALTHFPTHALPAAVLSCSVGCSTPGSDTRSLSESAGMGISCT